MPEYSGNLLLDSLPEDARGQILKFCVAKILPVRCMLYEAEVQPEYAYFMTAGIASIVTSMPDGATAEVGVTGREGVVGALHLLGPSRISTSCFMQLAGGALRIRFPDLLQSFQTSLRLREQTLEFLQSQAACLEQLGGCHRLHTAEQRLARWLLMVSDRIASNEIGLTQEFLGEMLGSRRTTVTQVATALQRAGAILYSRGHITILDRHLLQAAACPCYPVVLRLFQRLYWSSGESASAGDPPELSSPFPLA